MLHGEASIIVFAERSFCRSNAGRLMMSDDVLSSAMPMFGWGNFVKGNDSGDDRPIFIAHGSGVAAHVAPLAVVTPEFHYFAGHRFSSLNRARHRPLVNRIGSIIRVECLPQLVFLKVLTRHERPPENF